MKFGTNRQSRIACKTCLYENVKSKSIRADFWLFFGRAVFESQTELSRTWYEVREVEIHVEGEGTPLPASGYDEAD